jgi:hypothetical protein
VTFRFDKKTGEISEEKGVWDKNGKLINNLDTEESKK